MHDAATDGLGQVVHVSDGGAVAVALAAAEAACLDERIGLNEVAALQLDLVVREQRQELFRIGIVEAGQKVRSRFEHEHLHALVREQARCGAAAAAADDQHVEQIPPAHDRAEECIVRTAPGDARRAIDIILIIIAVPHPGSWMATLVNASTSRNVRRLSPDVVSRLEAREYSTAAVTNLARTGQLWTDG